MSRWLLFAFLSMVLSGTVVISQKYVTVLNMDTYIAQFLGISYLIGFAACLVVIVIKKYRVKTRALVYGAIAGIVSYIGSYLYIALMGVFPSSLIIPLFSFSSIVTVAIGSVVIFKERIGKRLIAAMAVGLLAVIALSV